MRPDDVTPDTVEPDVQPADATPIPAVRSPVEDARRTLLALQLRARRPNLELDWRETQDAFSILQLNDRRDEARALTLAWEEFVTRVLDSNWRVLDPLSPLVHVLLLQGQLALLEGKPGKAFSRFRTCERKLTEAAGGEAELLTSLACAEPGLIGGLYAESLVLGLRSGQLYFTGRPVARLQFMDPLIARARRLLDPSGDGLPVHAAWASNLYAELEVALGERNRPGDNALLRSVANPTLWQPGDG